jgi:hypothetical protein
MSEEEKIENLARSIWEFYYPKGGSVYRTYDSTQEHDKKLLREEAKKVSDFLTGKLILTEPTEPSKIYLKRQA